MSATLDNTTTMLSFGDERIPVIVAERGDESIAEQIVALDTDLVVVVTDDVVRTQREGFLRALGALVPVAVLSERPGEAMKSMSVLARHLDAAVAAGATKRTIVVGLGGGVPGNLAGMVAGLLFRGVRLVHVPTNVASATDSVLSLKQAVNSSLGKNQVGLYRIPEVIFVDLSAFATLRPQEIRAGLCEALKNALAIVPEQLPAFEGRALPSTPEEFVWLLDACIEAKSRVMRDDPYEQCEALVLEYGHTVGHAVELCDRARRGAGALSHGESIAFGMLVAAHISRRLGYLDDEVVELHRRLIAGLGAPTRLPVGVSVEDVMAYVRHDNKRGLIRTAPDHAPMVLLESLGTARTTEGMPLEGVPFSLIRTVLAEFVMVQDSL